MRTLPARLFRCILPCFFTACCLLTVAVAARAGEEDAPPKASDEPAVASPEDAFPQELATAELRAREKVVAGEIGLGLVASDPAVRARAARRLVARLDMHAEAPGDLEYFLTEMSAAIEVWAKELRHRHGQRLRTAPQGATPPNATPPNAAPPNAAPREAARTEALAGTPRRYDVRDLLGHGWTRFKLEKTLLREADAVSVREYDTGYIVTAPQSGHEHLGMFLAAVRSTVRSVRADLVAANRAKAAGQEDSAAAPQELAHAGGLAAEGQADTPQAPTALKPLVSHTHGAPAWRVVPMIVHLPRGKLLQARLAAETSAYGNKRPLLATSEVLTGSVADAKRWSELARQMPNARVDMPLEGETALAPGQRAGLFAGKEILYTKDYQRTAAGGLRPQTEIIRDGVELTLGIVHEASGLRVDLVAQRTDVGRPVPVVRFRPSENAPAVELECPQWSVTRRSDSFRLPHGGGGAFLPLPGIGSGPEDHVILVLAIVPYAEARQQAGVRARRHSK